MREILSPLEEERIAEFLSNLSPIEYDLLMAKVDRSRWIQRGPVGFIDTVPVYIPDEFKRKTNRLTTDY